METSDLLINLVISLGAGLIGALVAARLGQSVILGYLVGGILIGPETPGFVAEAETVDALANIGVILLLFAVGVQLSFRDLLGVGKVAIGGAFVQVLLMIGVGYGVGLALGWGSTQSLFFGAVLSNSSSTVMSKVLGDRGEIATPHALVSIGWSSVQDFSTVILIVVLSAVAEDGNGSLSGLPRDLGEAALFLALLVPMGAYAFPWFFERVAALKQREVLVLSIAAVAFGTAYASSLFGLSLALGAFAAGVAVAESDESHNIVREVLPLRDIFSALFFVSVGMLVDPAFLLENLPLVLLVVVLTVVVKGAMSFGIAAAFGVPAGTAVLTAALLGQSAEFSFLMARVGSDLGAIDRDAFSAMLAGAAGSIAVLSFSYAAARPAARWLEIKVAARAEPSAYRREVAPDIQDHVVICGYGRVGKVIGTALRRQGIAFIVIEEDREVVRDLTDEGVPVLMGAADNPILLDMARIDRAQVLVVTVPDPSAARQVVDYALNVNPDLLLVVRTHSEGERRFLERRGASEAVVGEHELALEMIRRTLDNYEVDRDEAQFLIDRLRSTDSEWETSRSDE